jgi:hypothetical protein
MRRFCLLPLLLALASGCGDSITETGDRNLIMPLHVGNEWIGRLTRGGGDHEYDTLRIVRDTTVASERWAIISTSRTGFPRADELYVEYLSNRSDGLYQTPRDYRDRIDGGKRMVKFPVALGDTAVDYGWYQQTFENGTQGNKVRVFGLVSALDELIDVPAGRFHAFEMRIKAVNEQGADTTGANFLWWDIAYFAPGVGLVKCVQGERGASPTQLWELYELRLE